jgi:hypothetical protein
MAFSVSFVKTNSLPNSPHTDWYLDAMDVATGGVTPRVPVFRYVSVRFPALSLARRQRQRTTETPALTRRYPEFESASGSLAGGS